MKRIVTIAILMLFIATNGITGKNTVDPNYAKIFNANAWGIEPSSEGWVNFKYPIQINRNIMINGLSVVPSDRNSPSAVDANNVFLRMKKRGTTDTYTVIPIKVTPEMSDKSGLLINQLSIGINGESFDEIEFYVKLNSTKKVDMAMTGIED